MKFFIYSILSLAFYIHTYYVCITHIHMGHVRCRELGSNHQLCDKWKTTLHHSHLCFFIDVLLLFFEQQIFDIHFLDLISCLTGTSHSQPMTIGFLSDVRTSDFSHDVMVI